MADLAAFASDPDAEVNGVWSEWRAGMRFRIARLWNVNYDRAWHALLAESAELPKPKDEKEEDAQRRILMTKACARALVTDWALLDGVIGDDGMPIALPPVVVDGDSPDAQVWIEDEADGITRDIGTNDDGAPIETREFDGHDGHRYRVVKIEPGRRTYKRIIPFSHELAERLLLMAAYRDLRKYLETMASQAAMYRMKVKEETAGN